MHFDFNPELKNMPINYKPVGITYYNGRMPNYSSQIMEHSGQ